ncbi:MAG: hypothetical protein JW969_07005 [Spirochaetales bacterium]|nr:hypothetical protein [Spirochaetales bacterium]
MQRKKIHITRNINVFLVVFLLTLAFPFLLFTIYPAMGISRIQAVRNSLTTFFLTSSVLFMVCLFLRSRLKPVDRLINNVVLSRELTDGEKAQIINIEKFVKKFVVILVIAGFLAVGTASVTVNMIRDGILRYATIRFLVVTVCIGPSASILAYIFIGYSMQKVKKAANIYEFVNKKSRLGLRLKMIIIPLAFAFFMVVTLVSLALSREEDIAGITNAAAVLRPEVDEKPHGYFTELLDLSLKSGDPAVRAAAEKCLDEWEAKSTADTSELVFIGFVSILLFGTFIFFYSSNMSSHLKGIEEKLKKVSNLEGDITGLLVKTADDEIGEIQVLYNRLVLNINRMLRDIFGAFNGVISLTRQQTESIRPLINANEEIKSRSLEITKGLNTQTEAVKKTAELVRVTINQINGNMKQIREQADMIEKSEKAFVNIGSSINSVTDATQKTGQLSRTLHATSQSGRVVTVSMQDAIREISESSSGITDLLDTISGITDQTNMLAMNASIEAAHAGDFGKGFAVVAEEIRKLAENTNNYTQEISTIIMDMKQDIDQSTQCSDNLTEAMNAIQKDINATLALIDEINDLGKTQLSASEQGKGLINSLVSMTERISASLVEQNLKNAELMKSLSEMENSTSMIEKVGKEQENYFSRLSETFADFSGYFNAVTGKFSALETMIGNVRLLEEKFFQY